MKKIANLILVTSVLIGCSSFKTAYGQDENLNHGKIGIGVNLFDLSSIYSEGIANSIYVPINVTQKFRIEPIVGFYFKEGESYISGSLGFFKLVESKDLLLKYGGRLGTFVNEGIFSVSPCIGAEYFLSKRFSIGAEAAINVFYKKDLLLSSGTSASLRFYF